MIRGIYTFTLLVIMIFTLLFFTKERFRLNHFIGFFFLLLTVDFILKK
jgi:uncharacterized protein